jgi:[protein-PII] uridylyltransferase
MTECSPDEILQRLADVPFGDAAALRARLVPEVRRFLETGREAAQERLLRTREGASCRT